MGNILGITAEYDPFHNGHAYQIRKARELSRPEAVVCAMSGDFTQRGEVAVLDKWERASLALQHGADLMFELPFIYACRRAEHFAGGAVDLLICAGATHISFGCEAEHPEDLQRLAGLQWEHEGELKALAREHMRHGCSHVKGWELACREMLGEELTELMLAPNNILALEYMRRMLWWEREKGVSVTPVPIRRCGSGYRQTDEATGFAGASALRQRIAAGEDIASFVPYDPKEMDWTDLDAVHQKLYEQIRGILLRSSMQQLARVYGIGEGMEHRLKKEAVRCETYDAFLQGMTSRRYTASAIRRIMILLMMGLEEMPAAPPYARLLGASAAGRRLLRRMADAKDGALVVISDGNRIGELDPQIRESYRLDRLSADMFHLLQGQPLDEKSDGRAHPRMG